jgi:ribonuclease Z
MHMQPLRQFYRSRYLSTAGLLLAGLLLGGCDKVQETAMDYMVKDRTDHSLLSDKDQIRVILCGTGTPQVRSPRGQACTLVAAGGQLFLFDAGENAMRNLENSHIPMNELNKVFITHLHSDHISGLGGLINYTWVNGRTTPLTVYGPMGVAGLVKGLEMAFADDARFRSSHFVPHPELAFAQVQTILFNSGVESVRVYEQDGVSIDAWRVDHRPVDPALGYAVSYRGKKVFISGDTRVSDIYLPAMQDADLVVHEAINRQMVESAAAALRRLDMSDQADKALRTLEYHSDTLELAALAEKAGARHLLLTHLIPAPPNFITRRMFLQGMDERYTGQITLGEDGMQVSVPAP